MDRERCLNDFVASVSACVASLDVSSSCAVWRSDVDALASTYVGTRYVHDRH